MSYFGRTASPILTMPLPSAHQAPLGGPLFSHQSAPFSQFPQSSNSWSHMNSIAQSHIPRGRKRSRDEAAINLDPPEKAPPAVEPVQEDDEWEYGPGMILIKKSSGYTHDASSQSGTWVDEKAAKEEARRTEELLLAQQREAQDRPSLRSHKSSRLDVTASLPPQETQVNRASPGRELSDASTLVSPATPDTSAQPVVDDFTLHLGIGWSRISADEHIQAAARGWASFIENHFPITNPQIKLESKGLESYLVEAEEGFFLFGENLRQGRLVSRDPQRVLDNLKTSPPTFDGADTMDAAVTPSAASTPKPVETEPMMTVPQPSTTTTDIDMMMN